MEKGNFHNGHEYVDLGLPSGTLWATKNINAANEVDFGSQFAWGEIEGHSTSHHFNLFDYMSNDGETKDFLTKKWDAAHKIMGGCWRIPSSKQFNELIKYTNYKFCKSNNSVVLVSKINGNEIKFPHDFTCDVRYNGYRTSESLNAFVLDFGRLHSDFGFDYLTKNHNGYCVRAVLKKSELFNKDDSVEISKMVKLEDVCQWLKDNASCYVIDNREFGEGFEYDKDSLIEDLKREIG